MNTLIRATQIGVLLAGLALVHGVSKADDTDIFTGSSGGTATAPNVMFFLDNTSNWATNATNTCASTPSACPTLPSSPAGQAYNTSGTVGGNQLNAIIATLATLYSSTTGGSNVSVGVAMQTASGNNQYGYVRFGARNIGDASTGATAYSSLNSLLSGINPNSSVNKVNVGKKDESEVLFELYQYYNGAAPGAGAVSISGLADYPGNNSATAQPKVTSTGANDTGYNSSTCGTTNTGCLYRSPTTSCSKNFIIYIVNHDHSNNGVTGSGSYNGLPSPALTAIAPWTVSGVTGESRWIYTWANYLFSAGITLYVVDIGSDATATNQYSIALQQAAKLGGGKYYALTGSSSMSGPGSLTSTLDSIFAEIQAVNSTFASATLPISATNRAQSLNQIFIPMFRPDAAASPLWKGNLKQYQLITSGGAIELGDASGTLAVNPNTGFAAPCAQSYWTTDSSTYWQNVNQNPAARGQCTTSSNSVWSDSPDGSFVEKGGVAEVIRKGNNPSGSTTWAVNRTIYTQAASGGGLTTFNTSSTGLASATGLSGSTTPTLTNMVNFISGQDVNSEYTTPPPPGISTTPSALTRPSLHGDTIHSRPQPVNYGGSTGVYVYYGSNDATLRAVNAANGSEAWAFIAPEFYSRLSRLVTQSPLVQYPDQPSGISPTPTPKDYFFDGSVGLYQNADNSKVWIYPSMRRGGRMFYAFDVTTPTSPVFKWKLGCPNLTDDTGCVSTSSSWSSSALAAIGQTWSMPNVAATVLGYTGPVAVVGGGYDSCEDANTSTPSCSSTKGANVYVINADTGALIATFPTGQSRAVAADVALISVANAGVVDHAYAVDTGGNIYRIDFDAGGPSKWVMNRVAYTNGSGRKFLYPPALLQNPNNSAVYLAIGSGDREHPLITHYPYTAPIVNRFYVYVDDLTTSSVATNLDDSASGKMINVSATAGCNAPSVLTGTGVKGWFFNLNQNGAGEQTVTSALIAAGMVTFSTNRPVPASAGSCSTALGEARGYWLNLFNGSGAIGVTGNCGGTTSSIFVGGGLPPSPVFASVVINGSTMPVVIGAVQRANGANSPISPQLLNPTISANRKSIYWKSSGAD